MNSNENYEDMDVAIIGMEGIFPKADSVEQFWSNLLDGKDCISRNEDIKEFSGEGYEIINAYGKVKGIYEFDNDFFNINKKEALEMDPQERKMLEISYKALEDAGIATEKYDGKIGIICGSNENEYSLKKYYTEVNNNILSATSKMYLGSSLASRIAYKLNLTGPCMIIKDTCATALAAVHTASQMLLNYESDIMLAGAANLCINNDNYIYIKDGITSKEGVMRAFSTEAGGCIPGDGAGIIVLKRLSDAKRDRDNIIAVIKGSAICNDGNRKAGFTAPSIEGEYEAIKEAMLCADVNYDELDYIESHGTATKLGDLVEIAALNKVFSKAKKNSIALGAVKNNVGHLNYASGCAGIMKAAMVLHTRQLPPVINVNEVQYGLKNTAFYINKEKAELKKEGYLRAGVSGFGIGGINTHIILEEYKDSIVSENKNPVLLVISAKTKEALNKYEKKILEFAENNQDKLENIAFTLQTGRNQYRYCCIVIVKVIDGHISVIYRDDICLTEEQLETNSKIKKEINLNGEDYIDYLKKYSEAFLAGYDIEWNKLYDISKVKKESISKYCFSKNTFNYFVDSEENKYLEITADDIDKIKELEAEQEKIENMLTEDDYPGINEYYEKIAVYAAANYFTSHEIDCNRKYTFKEIYKLFNVIPQYEYFVNHFIRVLSNNDAAEIFEDNIKIHKVIYDMDLVKLVEEAKKLYPDFKMKLQFILDCALQYEEVFTGRKEGNSVLYPEGKYDTILEVGANTPDISREPIYINAFPKIIKHFINKKESDSTVRILELGSGTGIITWPLLEELKDMNVEYYFTDLGKSFITLAKEKVKKMNYKNVIFKQYNIEKNYAEQGFKKESFDFIISMNVLQVAHNFEEAINNVSGLLKKNGIFACVQAFISENVNYLCYGYAPGWWNYEEDPLRRGKNIMLPHEDWRNLLEKLRFKNVNIIYDSINNRNDKFGFIFTNRPDEVEFFEEIDNEIQSHNTKNHEVNKSTHNMSNITEKLKSILEDVIGEEIIEGSSLFDLGFDSLSFLIVSSKIKEELNIEISVKELYDIDTLEELGEYVRQCGKKEYESAECVNEKEENNAEKENLSSLLDTL